MKKRDVEIGATYVAKVSGKITHVRIVGVQGGYASSTGAAGGWAAVNVETGRSVHIRSAARLRSRVLSESERQSKAEQYAQDKPWLQPALVSAAACLWDGAKLNPAKRGARLCGATS